MKRLTVNRRVQSRIPTPEGEFQLILYTANDTKEHLAVVMGQVESKEDVLVRVHSECFTGDVLGSLRCDCGEQLNRAMQQIANVGQGVVIYLRQEGRGIGPAVKTPRPPEIVLGASAAEGGVFPVAVQVELDLPFAPPAVRELRPGQEGTHIVAASPHPIQDDVLRALPRRR